MTVIKKDNASRIVDKLIQSASAQMMTEGFNRVQMDATGFLISDWKLIGTA
jgi:hypothetical protein